jgi:sporulation protein YlmC with PRC-barrel domain
VVKLSELKGRPVISIADAVRIGNIGDVLVDGKYQQIRGFAIQEQRQERRQEQGGAAGGIVSFDDVRAIGPDAVTVKGPDSSRVLRQPTGTGDLVSLNDLLGKKVLTEDGEVLGSITEVHFDPRSGKVDRFEFDGKPLAEVFGRKPSYVELSDLIGVGPHSVTVHRREDQTKAA